MVRWLHISDLHFGCGQALSNTMRKKLCQFLRDNPLDVDYLFSNRQIIMRSDIKITPPLCGLE